MNSNKESLTILESVIAITDSSIVSDSLLLFILFGFNILLSGLIL